jgi:hypothetical protein
MDFGSKFGQRKWIDYDKINAVKRAKKPVIATKVCQECGKVGPVGNVPISEDEGGGYMVLGLECGCMERA